jgi:hypothetical protein
VNHKFIALPPVGNAQQVCDVTNVANDNIHRHSDHKLSKTHKQDEFYFAAKMTENLKLIVQSVNKLLGTEYNLISYDSLSEEQLLQVLMDVFLKYGIIAAKVS